MPARPSRNSRDIWRLNSELKLRCRAIGLSSDTNPCPVQLGVPQLSGFMGSLQTSCQGGSKLNGVDIIAEFLLSGLLMGVVVYAANHQRLTQLSPIFVALLPIFYFGLC